MVREIVGCDEPDAARYVEQAGWDVKIAILLGLGIDPAAAAAMLERHEGNLRRAIDEMTREKE
jgi:N-acetylmuramic acid 6-phosphate etherase